MSINSVQLSDRKMELANPAAKAATATATARAFVHALTEYNRIGEHYLVYISTYLLGWSGKKLFDSRG